MSASSSGTPVLFLHGAWHGSWCWAEVLARVTGAGARALAVDMAGHGPRARRPAALTRRPFDASLLATEPSPVADVDLDQAGDLLISQIGQLGAGGPVVVVAHSAGGVVLTRAAQLAPGLVAHAVYLTAIMPASGVHALACMQMPENEGGLARTAVVADLPRRRGAAAGRRLPRALLRAAATGGVLRGCRPLGSGCGHRAADPRRAHGHRPGDHHAHRRPVGLGAPHLRDVHPGHDHPAGLAATVHHRRRRRLPCQSDQSSPLDAAHSPFLSMPGQVADIVLKLGH